SLQGYSPPYSF
nr:immunoglobulin light chain junction region [Macaca mulatta]